MIIKMCFYEKQGIPQHISHLQESHSGFSTISETKRPSSVLWVSCKVFQDTQYSSPRYKSNSLGLMGRETLIQGTEEGYTAPEMRQIKSHDRVPTTRVNSLSHTCWYSFIFPDSASCPWSRKQRWNEVSSPVCSRANSWYVMISCPGLCSALSLSPHSPRFSLGPVIFFKGEALNKLINLVIV